MAATSSRWGDSCLPSTPSVPIDDTIKEIEPITTRRSKQSVWTQFNAFCTDRNYSLTEETTTAELNDIMKDWAGNMKKQNGDDYKESVIKTMFNTTAQLLQEKYCKDFGINFNPFSDAQFRTAREARDNKRKELQKEPAKRKRGSEPLSGRDKLKMQEFWDERNPDGLLKKFYIVSAVQLGWRGKEAASAELSFFKEERDDGGKLTGRIEYNPVFSESVRGVKQGAAQRGGSSKWLTPNAGNTNLCPVRLFKQLKNRRSRNITTNRLFLLPNPYWEKSSATGWYKNVPVGRTELSTWCRKTAQQIGLRSAVVAQLATATEQQALSTTEHRSAPSVQPHVQTARPQPARPQPARPQPARPQPTEYISQVRSL